MSKRSKATGIQKFSPSASFDAAAQAACFALSGSIATKKAYWADSRLWVQFCREQGDDPWEPHPVTVTGWLASMQQQGLAEKTQMRRLSALSSVYERIKQDFRRDPTRKDLVNPFSIENGPARTKAVPRRPTPIADPTDVQKLLASCKDDVAGVRDEALIRVLWSTGARRASVASMTWDRMSKDRAGGYVASVTAKGGKEIRILLQGKAAAALERWLAELRTAGMTTGGIWRTRAGAVMTTKHLWRALKARAKLAGVDESRVSPHMFRVAFLTLNPASVAAKQHAAGHSDPATTAMYDRHEWRGREAFEAMPDPEDA
jgi:integrase/recombinase XerD